MNNQSLLFMLPIQESAEAEREKQLKPIAGKNLVLIKQYNTLFTFAPWPWPSEVLFTLGELYPCQTNQPREDCLGEGQV